MIRRALALALLLVSCRPRVPIAPTAARTQDPQAMAPGDWRGRGRIEASGFGRRLSADCLVRVQANGVRAVLLSDDGVVLADLEIAASGSIQHRLADPLASRTAQLNGLIAPFTHLPETQRTWRRGVLRAVTAQDVRWYGGDPLLLRRIEGRGWPVTITDHAPVAGGLVPRMIVADGPLGIELRLRLVELSALTPGH